MHDIVFVLARRFKRLDKRGAAAFAALALALSPIFAQTQAPPAAPDTASAWSVQGAIAARAVLYNVSGIPNRRNPFSYVLSGTVLPRKGDFSAPVTFTLSEQERTFSQPMNIFTVSPSYKWITLHAGFMNLTYSPYTLAGHQFLGAAIELTPGLFRLGAAYGRFLRAVEEDTTAQYLRIPAYERTGYAAKIGYGSAKNFFELSMLKGEDNPASLASSPKYADVLPGENLVVGASGRLTLFDDVFSLYADGAVSDYARDVRAQEISAENLSGTVPGADFLSKIIKTRLSTQIYTALNAGMSLNFRDYGLRAAFTRIDPDFRSMGAYYVNNDVQLINGSAFASFLNQTVRLTVSLGVQRDNLQNKKMATTKRLTPSILLSVNPSPAFGLDVQYTDMLTTQEAGNRALSDTNRMEFQNPLILAAPRLFLQSGSMAHLISLRGTYQKLTDKNVFTKDFTEYAMTSAGADYTLTFLYEALSISAGASLTSLDFAGAALADVTSKNVTLGANKTFWGVWNVGTTLAYSKQEALNILNALLQTSYKAGLHSFGASLTFMTNGASLSQPLFSEFTGVLSYAVIF